MALTAKHQIKIQGADKTQATALAIEFWTGKGFIVQSSSYNCIVLRRNGYGSVGKLLNNLINELITEGKDVAWDQIPTELTVLCQVLPHEANWDLVFKLSKGYNEINPGDFARISKSWCNEFSDFCHQWMNITN
jgi:hypothetical protein